MRVHYRLSMASEHGADRSPKLHGLVFARLPSRSKLHAAKRVAQLNPARLDALPQSEIVTPSKLRTE